MNNTSTNGFISCKKLFIFNVCRYFARSKVCVEQQYMLHYPPPSIIPAPILNIFLSSSGCNFSGHLNLINPSTDL